MKCLELWNIKMSIRPDYKDTSTNVIDTFKEPIFIWKPKKVRKHKPEHHIMARGNVPYNVFFQCSSQPFAFASVCPLGIGSHPYIWFIFCTPTFCVAEWNIFEWMNKTAAALCRTFSSFPPNFCIFCHISVCSLCYIEFCVAAAWLDYTLHLCEHEINDLAECQLWNVVFCGEVFAEILKRNQINLLSDCSICWPRYRLGLRID